MDAGVRRPLICGNWKMNAGAQDAGPLALAVARTVEGMTAVDVLVAPPFVAIPAVAQALEASGSNVAIAGQDMSPEPAGAFTGEVSGEMLRAWGATWVILGHSERRQLLGETDAVVARKAARAMITGPRPIVCVGETLEERAAGDTLDVIERQVRAVLDALALQPGFGAIAYEPVWAIGTGKVASPEDAQEVHARIRALLGRTRVELADATRILHGGSVKSENADVLLQQPDIDGALVGGAALDPTSFGAIVEAAQRNSGASRGS